MDFQKYGEKYLTDRGMFDDQASKIMKSVMVAPENDSMSNRWHDDIEGYLDTISILLGISLNDHALQYIDANIPKAWFREMFVR